MADVCIHTKTSDKEWKTKAFFPIRLVHKDTAMVNSIREKEVLCSWLFVCYCLKMFLTLNYFLFSIYFKNSFLSYSLYNSQPTADERTLSSAMRILFKKQFKLNSSFFIGHIQPDTIV